MSSGYLHEERGTVALYDSTVFRASTAHRPALRGSGRAMPHVFWIVGIDKREGERS